MTYTISKEVVRTHEHWTQFVHAHLRHAPPWNWCILHAWRCRLFDRPSGWRVCHQQPVLWSLSQDHRCCKSQVMPHEKRPRSQRRVLRRILLLQVANRIASGVLGVRVKKKRVKNRGYRASAYAWYMFRCAWNGSCSRRTSRAQYSMCVWILSVHGRFVAIQKRS